MDLSITEAAVAALSTAVVVVLGFVANWLKARATKERDEDQSLLRNQLRLGALDIAQTLAERSLPIIAQAVEDGEIKDVQSAKAALYEIGRIGREELRAIYPDIARRLGDRAIDQALRYAADNVNPFPGKDTAKALLSGGAKRLLELGIDLADDKLAPKGD